MCAKGEYFRIDSTRRSSIETIGQRERGQRRRERESDANGEGERKGRRGGAGREGER